GDFAVEALQDAFVGLMQNEYDWGKKGFPTKGKVLGMAKELLERQKISRETGWTDLLRKARLDWLDPGPVGRPPKREVDEIPKAKKEDTSVITKYVEGHLGGNWPGFLQTMKGRFGKKLHIEDEQARLKEDNKLPYEEDEELK